MKIMNRIPISSYSANGFIGRYQRLIKDTVIPYQYSVLNDAIPDTEKSHVIQNFVNAAKVLGGSADEVNFEGMVFQDSDAAKWIEAAAYSLINFPDEELENTIDDFIDKIAAAQEEDGYLDTYFTINDREKKKRWTNLHEAHELYCAGHMMEAACAYFEATGKDKLLKVMEKNAMHIYNRFITEGHPGYPGHPEVELALMRMYRATGNKKCLELAEHFINIRGVDPEYYNKEQKSRDWYLWSKDHVDKDYQQSEEPVRNQKNAIGHSVRAVYLYTGMADLASEIEDKELLDACHRLWESITRRRMYITGGIGSYVIGETFTVDYDLPNDTVYAETCASIGLIFFASRMLENEINGEYADIMERAFYNNVLAGMQLDGKRFFYVNPLETVPGISGVSAPHRHVLPQRPRWYGCACCPPNAARMISSFGQYAYGENDSTAFCHLFAAGNVAFKNGMKFTCETEYPYDFTITYKIEKGGQMGIRIPAWSKEFTLEINGIKLEAVPQKGYIYITVNNNDTVKLTLDSAPKFVYATTKVPRLTGMTALCRGPLVYCFEGVDNDNDVLSIALKRNGKLTVSEFDSEFLGGTVKITAEAVRRSVSDELYTYTVPEEISCIAEAVPYYTWGNRGENQMRIWMCETDSLNNNL